MKAVSIGTCSSDKKIALIKEKGVTHAINYTTSNYEGIFKPIYYHH